ncbi:uncharacterized protein LOC132601641 [Lycium barbarum]|uniref:uncharacterized protein LOC132601641 n=1 Tax=Lycium barbarum TaxID=112863 RepID=UPI00293EA339|nr:uncharacterized protein LOC132601641 [Lycium barbarum]
MEEYCTSAEYTPRHKFTLWLATWRRLATVDRLQRIGIHVPMDCIFCDSAVETLDHLLFLCPVTHALWNRLLVWLGIQRNIASWQEEVHWACKWARKKTRRGAIICCVFAMVVSIIGGKGTTCDSSQATSIVTGFTGRLPSTSISEART